MLPGQVEALFEGVLINDVFNIPVFDSEVVSTRRRRSRRALRCYCFFLIFYFLNNFP